MNPENQNINNQSITPPTVPVVKQPKAKVNWLIPVITLVVGVALGVGGLLAYQKLSTPKPVATVSPTPITQDTSTSTASPTPAQVSTITSIDNTWNLYTNNKFGFSIKVPKLIAGESHNNCPSNYAVSTAIYDDNIGVYITDEYFYEYPQNNVCQKTINNLSIIDQRANQWKSGQGNPLFVPNNWHIITANASNDSELESFIKSNYGTGCKLGAKSLSSTGMYDVKIQGDGLDLGVSKCPINFVYSLKYSPELRKAATWGVGQAVTFSSPDYKQSYDSEMINSFKFTN